MGYGFLQTKNGKLEDASSEKLDLITLCVSAIPRILPDGFKQYQTRNQIIKIISQLTIHQSKSLQDQRQGSTQRSFLVSPISLSRQELIFLVLVRRSLIKVLNRC